jgi:hypothetical protein
MKKLYFFTLFSSLFISISAQTFDWAKRAGLYEYDYGYGIATDNSGNVYVAGKYEMNADFSGTTLSNAGNHDIYVAKYGSDGTLGWVTTGGGTLGDYAHSIACDGNSIYIAGEIEGYGNLINFQNSAITLNSIGDNDLFLAKYDLNGTLLWAKSAGGLFNEKALGITYDNSGNVYICGFFNDTANFSGTKIYGTPGKANDIFVAKYDMNGTLQWVRQAGSAGRDEAKSIKCDANGNVYICGMYSNGAVFGSQTLTSPNGYFNAFVAKYTSAGTLSWVKTAGGDVDDVAWSLTVDNAGQVFVTGEYNAYAVFDSFSLLATGSGGNADIFVACYDATGNVKWVKGAGGVLIDRARGIGTDGTNIFITGQFGTTASFGSFTATAADSSDIFIAGLNNSGNFIWATSVGGLADSVETLGYESGNGICTDKTGGVYATGSLLNGGIFGTTTLSQYSRTDIFITKLSQVVGIAGLVNNSKDIHVYPNPGTGNFTLDLEGFSAHKTEMTIYNYLGQVIDKRTDNSSAKINIDLSGQVKGVYFIEVRADDQKTFREKIILQ